ncbi:MAG: FkbM family methyltransferase, partial [Candidatus Korobacteraceae bacterium]
DRSAVSGGSRSQLTVQATTLDSLLEKHPAPNIIKIDVEGAEKMVLSGGMRLLQNIRPIIFCDLHGANADWFVSFVQQFHYALINADNFELVFEAAAHTIAIPTAYLSRLKT